MLIIGELINCARKKVGQAAAKRDVAFFQDIARKQVNAGADMLDVNGGLPGQEGEVLPWLVNLVQEAVSVPLCLDSADPEALRRALPLTRQRAMINSITDEPARIQALLPILKEFRPKVIALCMGEAGPPNTAGILLMARGLDAGIVDPCNGQLMANIRAAEALLGRDEYCAHYLQAFREGTLELPTAA